jgi:hypothetical protein
MNESRRIILGWLVIAALFCQGTVSQPPGGNKNAEANGNQGDSRQEPCDQLLEVPGKANGLQKRCEGDGTGGGAARGDFNGDNIADLAVGVPFEDQDGVNAVGGVNIIYGSPTGLTSTSDQFLDETDFGFGYASNDHFGWALASGNFNGDEFSDLAIGIPDRDSTGLANTGRVVLIDGSLSGLLLSTARELDVTGGGTTGGRIGAALVWADFNDDGFGDLAVGAPNAEIFALFCTTRDAGAVHVFYGSETGLRQFGRQTISQRPCGTTIGDAAESGDRFGFSLAAGDFDGDGGADLVVGIPGEDLGLFDKVDAGKIFFYRGFDDTGLSIVNPRQELSQDTPGVGGGAETGDQFGMALATGDFNGDGRADLAVGIPFEDLLDNTASDGGAIQVFLAPNDNILGDLVDAAGDIFISQSNLPNVSVESGDRFGWALAVGKFDGDSFADLAVGAPGENIGTVADAGIVHVLYGTASGPSTTRVQLWQQDTANVPDISEGGDQFGFALSSWNYGKSDHADLAIGAPFEDLVSTSTGTLQLDAGAATVIYGSAGGLAATAASPAQLWTQDSSGINDTAQPDDNFGRVLY